MSANTLPVKPGDWVSDGAGRVAKVKDVFRDQHGVAVNLYLYSQHGERLPRQSPAMGGPRSFEPACAYSDWFRIEEPKFPIVLKWIPQPDGRQIAGYDTGPRLPDRQWVRPKRKVKAKLAPPDEYHRALQSIANGHNDPRRLASDVLRRKA